MSKEDIDDVGGIWDQFDEVRDELAVAYAQIASALSTPWRFSANAIEDAQHHLGWAMRRLEDLRASVIGARDPQLEDYVLIIDDDPLYCRALKRKLSRPGLRVFFETDAERGLSVALASPPALAIIDVCMPNRTGDQVAALIKATHPFVCVVLVTGGVTDRRLFEAGAAADFFVEKAVGTDILVEIADNMFRDDGPSALVGFPDQIVFTSTTTEKLTDDAVRRRNARSVHVSTGENVTKTADHLGVSRKTVRRLLGED